jgi:hypothetical protein
MVVPAAVGLLLAFMVVFAVAYLRLRRGARVPRLRPLPGAQTLPALAERALEEGRPVHLALGTGQVTHETSAETLMALVALDHMAASATRTGRIPVVTTADPAAHLLAADILAQGEPVRAWHARNQARFIAPDSAAYGAGTRGLIQREDLRLTAAIGYLGDEYLFLAAPAPGGGEAVAPPEVAATTRLESLPLLHLTVRKPLLGEETFALGAYLARLPADMAGVLLQDVARVVLVLAIVAGVILRSIGLF